MRTFNSTYLTLTALVAGTLVGGALTASAGEIAIGVHEKDGMAVAAVYLQPVEMEPVGMMRPAKDSDIHLEADIKALDDNKNGFPDSSWIPYLTISYELTKLDSKETIKGDFMPMVASDGPHYGDNVKLMGPGKYKLILNVSPPGSDKSSHFGRHTDKETGVGEWFKPFSLDYEFTYAGTGKKGAY